MARVDKQNNENQPCSQTFQAQNYVHFPAATAPPMPPEGMIQPPHQYVGMPPPQYQAPPPPAGVPNGVCPQYVGMPPTQYQPPPAAGYPPYNAVTFPPQPEGTLPLRYSPLQPPPPPSIGIPAGGYAQYVGMPPPQYHESPNPHSVVQMLPHQLSQVMSQGWQSDLFGCFDDFENALITVCCPCVTFGQIAEILDNGQTSCATSAMLYSVILYFTALPCIITCWYRTKLRSRYNLPETPAPDWLVHFCCEPCALCQAYRELKHRGIDPTIGWHGNVQRQQQTTMVAPPMYDRMMRR